MSFPHLYDVLFQHLTYASFPYFVPHVIPRLDRGIYFTFHSLIFFSFESKFTPTLKSLRLSLANGAA